MNSSASALPNLTKHHILSLYRHLLRGSKRFSDYNFREYALRIIREDFHKFKTVTDAKQIYNLYQKGVIQLGVVNRQGLINSLYAHKLSIMEPGVDQSKIPVVKPPADAFEDVPPSESTESSQMQTSN